MESLPYKSMPTPKAVIFDADGMLITGERFSGRLSRDYGIPIEVTLPFFQNPLALCQVGKADMREELAKVLPAWGWKGTLDDLLEYWFSTKHNSLDERFVDEIKSLRQSGVRCYLATNNEKYRTEHLRTTLGLGEILDGIFASGEVGAKKTSLEFLTIIQEKIALPSSEIMYWDDRPNHIDELNRAGFQARLYTDFESWKSSMIEDGFYATPEFLVSR